MTPRGLRGATRDRQISGRLINAALTSLALRGRRCDDCGRTSGHEGAGHRAGAAYDVPQAIGARDG